MKGDMISVLDGAARCHLNLDNVDKAIELFEKVIALDSDYFAVNTYLSLLYLRKKEYSVALGYSDRAVSIDPDVPVKHDVRGDILKNLGRIDEALVSYKRSLELKPDDAIVNKKCADILFKKGKYDEAVEYYKKVTLYREDNWLDYLLLGRASLFAGKYRKAIQALERAQELDPKQESVVTHLSEAHKKLGNHKKVFSVLSSFVDKNPNAIESRAVLGNIYCETNQCVKGMQLLKQSYKLHSRKPHHGIVTFLAYSKGLMTCNEDFSGALEVVEEGLEIFPFQAPLIYLKGNALLRLSKSVREMVNAVYQLELSIKLGHNTPEVIFEVARYHTRLLRNHKRARELVEQALKTGLNTDNQANAHLCLGEILYNEDNYKRAVIELNKSNDLRPRNHATLNYLALSYLQLGDYGKVIQILNTIPRSSPGYAEAQTTMAVAYISLGKEEKAKKICRAIRRDESQNPFATMSCSTILGETGHINETLNSLDMLGKVPATVSTNSMRGMVLFKEEKYGQSIKILEPVLDNNPDDEVALMFLGLSYDRLKKYDKALSYYERLAVKNPRQIQVYGFLALIYQRLGKTTEALKALEKRLELSEGYAGLYIQYADLLAKVGEYKKARIYFDKAVKEDPRNSDLYFIYGIALYQAGQKEEALDIAKRGHAIDKYNTRISLILGLYHMERGEFSRALSVYNEAMSEEENQERKLLLNYSIAYTLLLMNDLEGLKRELESSLKSMPQHYRLSILMLWVDLYERQGKSEESLNKFREMVAEFPEQRKLRKIFIDKLVIAKKHGEAKEELENLNDKRAFYYLQLGKVLIRLGQRENGEALIKEGFKLYPNDAELIVESAEMDIKYGNLDKGLEKYEKALVLKPDDYLTRMRLALLYLRSHQNDQALKHITQAVDDYRDQLKNMDPIYASAYNSDPELSASVDGLVTSSHGIVLLQNQHFSEAAIKLEKALKYKPEDEFIRRNLESARDNRLRLDFDYSLVDKRLDQVRQLSLPSYDININPEVFIMNSAQDIMEDGIVKREMSSMSKFSGLAERGKTPIAHLKDLEAELKKGNADVELYIKIGAVLLKLRRYAQAKEHFSKALELNPSSKVAQKGLNQSKLLLKNDMKNIMRIK